MKRFFALSLVLALFGTGCAQQPEEVPGREQAPIPLAEVAGYSGRELTQSLSGIHRDDIIAAWGEQDGSLSGFWGDVWFLDENEAQRITLYYDGDGLVDSALLAIRDRVFNEDESVPDGEGRVMWVSSTISDAVLKSALNAEKLDAVKQDHLPIYRCETGEELAEVYPDLTGYGAEFFETQELLLVYVMTPDLGPYYFETEVLSRGDGSVCVYVTTEGLPERAYADALCTWLVAIPVDKGLVRDGEGFDAVFTPSQSA